MDRQSIDRLNELAKKSRTGDLTKQEKEEQQKLRKIYIESIKRNFRATLESIKIVPETGSE